MGSVAIIGGGESGVGAALLAKSEGKDVFLSEYGKLNKKYKNELLAHDIPFEEEGHSIEKLKRFEIIVKSPGVSDTTEVIRGLNYYGTKIISEIEFGFYYAKAKIIGITGSNGKTTTTGLIYHLLKCGGVNAQVGGNIGKSFARLVYEDEPCEVYVLELSSFQLDGIEKFKPSVAVLLNITPDHLDRYEYKFENYVRSKMRISMNQDIDDLLIYNQDDDSITEYVTAENARQQRQAVRKANYKTSLLSTEDGRKFETQHTSLKGMHNRFNSVCAIYAAQRLGVSDDDIQHGLESFVNVPHRLEMVATIDGVSFINDSKATNVDAVYYALEAIEGRIIWIAGGTDKGNDYGPLMELVEEKVAALICLGKDNTKLKSTYTKRIDLLEETIEVREAVKMGFDFAQEGDTVLLSPACASFDLFKNYEDRGDQFREAVLALKDKK